MADYNPAACIGPNAVIRLAEALKAARLNGLAEDIFAQQGHADWLLHPPATMVPEADAARLHQAVRARLQPERACAVLGHAGRLTADYLLAVRIPRPVQTLLKILPAHAAAMVLVAAISRNAWTFAGSGQFSASWTGGLSLTIAGNPLCACEAASRPVCDWHRAVFQRLFETLVSPRCRVTELSCKAAGGACCRFAVDWHGTARESPPCETITTGRRFASGAT